MIDSVVQIRLQVAQEDGNAGSNHIRLSLIYVCIQCSIIIKLEHAWLICLCKVLPVGNVYYNIIILIPPYGDKFCFSIK